MKFHIQLNVYLLVHFQQMTWGNVADNALQQDAIPIAMFEIRGVSWWMGINIYQKLPQVQMEQGDEYSMKVKQSKWIRWITSYEKKALLK